MQNEWTKWNQIIQDVSTTVGAELRVYDDDDDEQYFQTITALWLQQRY